MEPNAPLSLSDKLEALLFAEGQPVARKKLVQLLGCSAAELDEAASVLAERRKLSGIALIRTENELALAIAQSATKTIEDAFSRELGREVGDAGLEVIAILLYRGPSTRAQIDYIRGVNSSSTTRTLVARGLIERTLNPEDAREYLYKPTTELLAHLGATNAHELPDYAKISSELAAFEQKAGPFHEENHVAGDEDSSS